jgi:hypothetical protein
MRRWDQLRPLVKFSPISHHSNRPLDFQHLENGGRDAVRNFEADDIVFEHLLSEQGEPLARAIEFLRNKERAAIALLEHVLHAGVNGLRFAKKIRRERNLLGLGVDVKRGHFAVFFEFVIEECLQQLAGEPVPHEGF